ncbi:Flp family type IVb pilin [Leptolyngbya sp. 15MV]|nr:Flp family type IVb pilin [Leptolyngbya sp. 15MV]
MELKTILKRIGRDTSGATAIEYGLIVSLVVIACIGAFESVADSNTGLWATVTNKTSEAME